jgi:cytochrome o ubiquinol oxidase subunit II
MRARKNRIKFAVMSLAVAILLGGCKLTLLDPKGPVGLDERNLILIATALMLIVVIPVIVLTLVFAWWYRASNAKATYLPKWAHSSAIEAVVWGVPLMIIIVLGWLAWTTTHQLDPYRPLAAKDKTLVIDVVALDWKWLFVYPDKHIATVNEVAFPVGTPVEFHVTSDSVMNSFFIPGLAGQIYAMAGMQTKLSLIASEAGTFDGMSANYSGAGFSGMKFKALALPKKDYDAWVAKVRAKGKPLDAPSYAALAKPSSDNPAAYYAPADPGLFQGLIGKYMGTSRHTDQNMQHDTPAMPASMKMEGME